MINESKLGRMAKAQEKLSARVVEKPLDLSAIKTVAAVDVAYKEDTARAGFVLCSFPECAVVKAKFMEMEVSAPYVPTFFFLRETRPVLLAVWGESFDVLLVEGHGKAHPRGYGLASHIGLLVGRPTIGVAKRPLRGSPRNSFKRVGKAYVSVGHLINLESALRIVESLLDEGYPMPLKLADRLSKRGRI
ncbi:endonuclease V [Thermococcus sp. MV11]|nr:endonuclease V [Thermococcus sp. MV11]